MIPKDYVTHAKPQLTSLMIQKCYVTHAGRQLIFKKLKFVLTRNLKFEYNVHCLTFRVLLSAKFTDDSRAVPIRQTKIRTNKLRWYQPTLSFYWFFQQPLVSSCLIWGISYSTPPTHTNMIFVVDVWFSLYFPSFIWKRAIFEVFAHGIFYFVLCMYQYQASRQPWWTVSFWFWSRPSGWCLQTWDVLDIWYDNLLHYLSSIVKNRCFCAQFTGLWS